jgi:hypothetical protein
MTRSWHIAIGKERRWAYSASTLLRETYMLRMVPLKEGRWGLGLHTACSTAFLHTSENIWTGLLHLARIRIFDNVEDFSDIQEVIELVRIQQVEIQESQRLDPYQLPEATFPDNYKDKSTRWATVGRARKKDRQALGGDPPEMKVSNYYAVLNVEEIDNETEIQNVTGEKISAATNDLIRPVGAPNRSKGH